LECSIFMKKLFNRNKEKVKAEPKPKASRVVKGTVQIIPDMHDELAQAGRDYIKQQISDGGCEKFAIEFAPEYKLSGLIKKINRGEATDNEIDDALKTIGSKAVLMAPILKEALKQNQNFTQCQVIEWKAQPNTKAKQGQDKKDIRLADDTASVAVIEKSLSSDDTPILLLAGAGHVKNLSELLKKKGYNVEILDVHYGEGLSLIPPKINKTIQVKEVIVPLHDKDLIIRKQMVEKHKKEKEAELKKKVEKIKQTMNKRSEQTKSKTLKEEKQPSRREPSSFVRD